MSKRAFIVLALSLCLAGSAHAAACPEVTPLPVVGGLSDPSWVAVDSGGIVYVTENVADRIKVFSPSGRLIRSIEHPRPFAIAVDGGLIYVTSSSRRTLSIYGTDGTLKKSVDTGIKFPSGIALSPERVYLSDPSNSRIKVYDRAGNYLFYFGSDGTNFVPIGLAYEAGTGQVYAVSRVPAGVFVFDEQGRFVRKFYSAYETGGVIAEPRGIVLDAQGRLYVSDAVRLVIHVFDNGGTPVCSFSADGGMNRPFGMAMSGAKVLSIADKDGGRMHQAGMDDFVMLKVASLDSGLRFAGSACINPPGQSVTLTNEGKGVLRWRAEADSSWITVAQTTGELKGGESAQVEINVSTEGLSEGTYQGNVKFSGEGVSEVIAVTVEILPPPTLSVSPEGLSFTQKGTNVPPSQGITVELSGDRTGAGTWSAQSDGGWLKVSPASGPSNTLSMVSASVDVTGLPGGTHTGRISIEAGCAKGSPAGVTVSLEYIKGGTINVLTNLNEASYTITGPQTYSGAGISYQADAVPEGAYTITFGRVKGFKAPLSYSLSVLDGQVVQFTGNYKDLRKQMKVVATMGKAPESIAEELRVYERAGTLIKTMAVEEAGKGSSPRYGSQTAVSDMDGDGTGDILVARGKGGAVTGYKADGATITGLGFTAFKGLSAEVSAGDLDGDGLDEIVVGSGPSSGNPAEVRVFTFKDGVVSDTGIDFLAYTEKTGVNIAVADIDGDEIAEILAVRGHSGDAPLEVRLYKVDALQGEGKWLIVPAGGFNAGGSFGTPDIAGGDIDGDGIDEVIIASVPQPSGKTAKVTAYRPDGTVASEFAVEAASGIAIAAGDTDFDGVAEVAVGDSGSSNVPARIRVYDAGGVLINEFTAFDNKGVSGVRVSMGELDY